MKGPVKLKDPFDRALRMTVTLNPATLAAAESARRTNAALRGRPDFPEGWPEPRAQYWVTVALEGDWAERFHAVEPPVPHLTVWRFMPEGGEPFEATATFAAFSNASGVPTFTHRHPPGDGWEFVGPTTDHSTLWRRPFKAERFARAAQGASHE
ncbi:MAG: hypothetical protein EA376_00035 [Phycisphaeraceae bacterium]|nr:MAG: hypothetical protein EA376_00035 [Phycisphaeraceae bacterium]